MIFYTLDKLSQIRNYILTIVRISDIIYIAVGGDIKECVKNAAEEDVLPRVLAFWGRVPIWAELLALALCARRFYTAEAYIFA